MTDTDAKFTILAVDDAASNIDVLVDLLADNYDVLVALDGPTALQTVADEPVDLVLLDIMMPDMSGFDVCRRLKRDTATRDIPVIFLTARTDESSIETAYDVGGIDYVTKPFKRTELLARIRTQLQLRTLVNELAYLANHDSLTGVLNRRAFFAAAAALIPQSVGLCTAMMDIDDFKSINDRFGHAVGDEVIRQTAAAIASHLPDGSLLGRLGGEEFAVVANGLTQHAFFDLVEDIREAISTLEIVRDGRVVSVNLSSGVAFQSSTRSSIDDLLRDADEALYRAKAGGKNRTVRLIPRSESA